MSKSTFILPVDDQILSSKLFKFVYSQKEKEADKFAIIKHIADAVRSNVLPEGVKERWIENMNIHMGRWNNTKSNNKVSIKLRDGKTLSFGRDKTRNHPYLDLISQSIATDFNSRPVQISITDTSKYANHLRKKRTNDLIKERLKELFVQPLIAKATQIADARYGGDPLSLPEEAIQQRNQEINDFVLQNLSEDIKKMLDNQVLPSEKLQKRLFDICYERNDMDFKMERAVDYMLTTSVVAFIKEFGFNEVYFNTISPSDLTYELSFGSIMLEDGLHANAKRYLSPMEVIQEAYHVFKNKDWKDVEKMLVNIPGSNYLEDANIIHKRTNGFVDTSISFEVGIVDGGIDMARDEYRPFMVDGRNGILWAENFKRKLNDAYLNRRQGLVVDNPTWRWNAKAKLVTRIVDGKIRQFIRGEHYVLNKKDGDISVDDTVIPQTYRAKVYGDYLYSEMKPVEGQYTDPFDISKPKLSIYGAEFMTIDGDVKNLTIFEPSKIYQQRFSEVQEAIGDAMGSDLGTVLFVNKKTFEGQGGPESFFDMLYKLKTVVTEDAQFATDNSGAKNVFTQNFSSGAKIAEYIQLANYYQNLMVKMMRYNEAKLGSQGQYENQANIQASLAAPDRQMGRMHSILLKVKSNLVEAMGQAAVIAYEKNEELLSNYLDEELYLYFTEHYDELIGTKFVYKTTSSLEEYDNLRQYKSLLVNYMSTGGDLHNLAEALEAKDMAKAKELGKASELLKARKESEARKHEKDLAELNSRTMQMIEKERLDRADAKQLRDLDVKKETAYIYSMTQANAADTNANNVPDAVERDKIKQSAEDKRHKEDLKIENRKLDIQERKIEVDSRKNNKK